MRHPSTPARRPQGAVLVLVLIFLALLSLLAVALATTSALDRTVSRNYVDQVRARLVARSGIEHAISRLQAAIQDGRIEDPSMVYWGSNTLEKKEPDEHTPLSRALNPSYALEDEDVQDPDDDKVTPVKFTFEDRVVGISGALTAGTYARHGDIFRLRVTDANSRILVNDGLKDPRVTKNLRRILNNLGTVCNVPDAGDRLISRRPVAGYRSKKELIEVLGEPGYVKMGHHLTLWAWVDPDVVNPVPLSQEVLREYPVDYNELILSYRYGRSRDAEGIQIDEPLKFAPEFASPTSHDHAILALDEVSAPWIGRSARAPVNVNAASEEILTALIMGLKGFFIAERRKNNPSNDVYSPYVYPKFDYRPGGKLGDEYGYLYSTAAFEAPRDTYPGAAGGTMTEAPKGSGVPADKIAKEIIACRERRESPHGMHDYGKVWWGGPFRTWRQFNAFCDGLVTNGLLVDPRPIYSDYSPVDVGGPGPFGGAYAGSDELVSSMLQPMLAAEALASVLKANFNPNCTPNELNPDHNLYLLIDKTDLICHSTEFCFSPMGCFDIESEGIVLKTANGDEDVFKTRTGVVQAKAMFECGVQLFEVFRDTTQADFLKGDLGPVVRSRLTNSNRPLETGPEPDIGKAPSECRWSGWVQLSTNGGIKRTHPPGGFAFTPAGDTELGAAAFGHFQFDQRLNHHSSGTTNLFEVSMDLRNQADRTEGDPGPYAPSKGTYRLGRDWELTAPPPAVPPRAMSDLRIDGSYVERDSALMFRCDSSVFATDGTISYWIKPSFRPEMTGKPRTFFSTEARAGSFPLMNGHWFFPCHHSTGGTFAYWEGPWSPACFVAGFATVRNSRGGVGRMSGPLNLGGAATEAPSQVLLKHHQWTHVAYMWNMNGGSTGLLVNGRPLTSQVIHVHPGISMASDWTAEGAVFRLGEPSHTMEYQWAEMAIWGGGIPTDGTISRNWSADSTMDEMYLWKGNRLDAAAQLYDRGRYFVPRPERDTSFTSRPIVSPGMTTQKLPEPSKARPPVRTSETDRRRTYSTQTADGTRGGEGTRILGARWTWYPEFVEPKEGLLRIRDYFREMDLDCEVRLQFVINEDPVGTPLSDDGGSNVGDIFVKPDQALRYRLKFVIPKAGPGSILHATPIVDDVSIFFTRGRQFIHFGPLEGAP